MTQQGFLFEPPPANSPIRQPAPEKSTAPASVNRPTAWRAPTAGERACHGCGGAACYGDGPTWYCRVCVPAGFLPHTRGQP